MVASSDKQVLMVSAKLETVSFLYGVAQSSQDISRFLGPRIGVCNIATRKFSVAPILHATILGSGEVAPRTSALERTSLPPVLDKERNAHEKPHNSQASSVKDGGDNTSRSPWLSGMVSSIPGPGRVTILSEFRGERPLVDILLQPVSLSWRRRPRQDDL